MNAGSVHSHATISLHAPEESRSGSTQLSLQSEIRSSSCCDQFSNLPWTNAAPKVWLRSQGFAESSARPEKKPSWRPVWATMQYFLASPIFGARRFQISWHTRDP